MNKEFRKGCGLTEEEFKSLSSKDQQEYLRLTNESLYVKLCELGDVIVKELHIDKLTKKINDFLKRRGI